LDDLPGAPPPDDIGIPVVPPEPAQTLTQAESTEPPAEPGSAPTEANAASLEPSSAPAEAEGIADAPESATPAEANEATGGLPPVVPGRALPRFIAAHRGRLAIAIALLVCLSLAVSGAALLLSRRQPSSTPDAGAMAVASPTDAGSGSSESAIPTGAASLSAWPSPAVTPEPTPEPTPVPIPTQTSPTATVTVNDLVLDSTTDPAARPRTFTFVSDGPGLVSVQVVAGTATSSTKLCVSADAGPTDCVSGAAPGFPSLITTTAHSRWQVTVASADEGSPAIDLALRWPADNPSIAMTDGRFQGVPNTDALRSLTATFRTRSAGRVTLTASWPPIDASTTLTLTTDGTPNRKVVDKAQFAGVGSIAPAYSHAVSAGTQYQIVLFNDSADNLRPNLSATITFP
jgi:hypothetical protein